jgi:hypothetical protein
MVSTEFPLSESTYISFNLKTYSEAFVLGKTLNLLDVIAIQNECLQIRVLVYVLNFID